MKKLTPKTMNEVLDLAFQKLPFHVYLVMCDVGEIALKTECKARVVKLSQKATSSCDKKKCMKSKSKSMQK
jgi:hypothetical protein